MLAQQCRKLRNGARRGVAKAHFSIITSHQYLSPNKDSSKLIDRYPNTVAAQADFRMPWAIHMKDETQLIDKLKQIRKDGVENLMVMSDFDFTISKQFYPVQFLTQEQRDKLNGERMMGYATMTTMRTAPS